MQAEMQYQPAAQRSGVSITTGDVDRDLLISYCLSRFATMEIIAIILVGSACRDGPLYDRSDIDVEVIVRNDVEPLRCFRALCGRTIDIHVGSLTYISEMVDTARETELPYKALKLAEGRRLWFQEAYGEMLDDLQRRAVSVVLAGTGTPSAIKKIHLRIELEELFDDILDFCSRDEVTEARMVLFRLLNRLNSIVFEVSGSFEAPPKQFKYVALDGHERLRSIIFRYPTFDLVGITECARELHNLSDYLLGSIDGDLDITWANSKKRSY